MASVPEQGSTDKQDFSSNSSISDATIQFSEYILDAITAHKFSSNKHSHTKPDQQKDVDEQALSAVANRDVKNNKERHYFKKYGQQQGQDDRLQLNKTSWRQKQGNFSNRSYQKLNENHDRSLNENWRSNSKQQEVNNDDCRLKSDQSFNDNYAQQYHASSDNNLSSGYHHGEKKFNLRRNFNQRGRHSSIQQHQGQRNDNISNLYKNDQQNAYQSNSKRPQYDRRISHSSSRNGHNGRGFYTNRNANQYPQKNDRKRQQFYRSFSGPFTPEELPSWKLFLLRSSYDPDQVVEFHRHNGSYYDDEEDIDKLFYKPYLLNPIESNQQEINDIASVFQEWIDKIQTKCTNPSIFNGIYIKIRYGCSYITLLDPYIDQMPVAQFKAHFNRFLTKTDQSSKIKRSYRISTGFYPVFSSCSIDVNDHAASVLSFDTQKESILIHGNTHDYKTQNSINYNAEMELLKFRKDIILFKLDVKNTSLSNDFDTTTEGNDARITLYSDIYENSQETPSNCKLTSKDNLPPIKRDSQAGFVVELDCRQSIISVRQKRIKSYKLKNDLELWDLFREAAIVRVSDVTEYRLLDQATGQFKDVHRKHEVYVKVPLHQLLMPENCQKLAQNIHSLTFTILPKCFS